MDEFIKIELNNILGDIDNIFEDDQVMEKQAVDNAISALRNTNDKAILRIVLGSFQRVFMYNLKATRNQMALAARLETLFNDKIAGLWMKPGVKVHYKTPHGEIQNGIVKDINSMDFTTLFVVYNCGGDWDNYENYTAASTKLEHLGYGWLTGPIKT